MLALALTLLSAVPSAAALAESGHARGMLVQVEVTAPAEPAPPPFSQMTRSQLKEEYRHIDESRPGIAGQIVAISLGGVCTASGLFTIYFSLLTGITSRVPLVGIAVGLGLLVGGAGLLVFGIIMLKAVLRERAPYGEQMDEIQQRLDGTYEEKDRDGNPVAPPPVDPTMPVTPPPPPPPSSADLWTVPPMMVLARF